MLAPQEAFGLVQLEAMHCGKPVVATRLGTGVEFVNRDDEDRAACGAGRLRRCPGPSTACLQAPLCARAWEQRTASGFPAISRISQMVNKTLDVYRAVLNA
jgi:glycogen synthase